MIRYRYQTAWKRFFASWIDAFVLIPFIWGMDLLVLLLDQEGFRLVWAFVSYQIYWIYTVVMHARGGRTVGKIVMKVKVIDAGERHGIGWAQAFRRESVFAVFALVLAAAYTLSLADGGEDTRMRTAYVLLDLSYTLWIVLEWITMLLNNRRRAIHDFIGGTVVIRTE